MSAFVVPDSHITLLAVFLHRHKLITGKTVKEIGDILLSENVRSVATRYPDIHPSRYEKFRICEKAAFARPATIQVIVAASCLEYQSCEHDAYWNSEAYSLMRLAYQSAMALLEAETGARWDDQSVKLHPDYNRAAWTVDFHPETAKEFLAA